MFFMELDEGKTDKQSLDTNNLMTMEKRKD